MEEIIHYLELKNHYYEKFWSVSVKYLDKAQVDRWDDLNFFVDNRERILNIIRSFDYKVAKLFQELDPKSTDFSFYRPRIKALLEKRTELAKKILEVDLELISKIDEVKSETIQELRKTLKTTKEIGSFTAQAPKPRLRKALRNA